MPGKTPAFISSLGLALAGLVAASGPVGEMEAADTVFHGGAVYTVNKAQPWATAVAVRDGHIAYVGDDVGAQPWVGPNTRVHDLDGRMLMPGFIDSHNHPMAAGTRYLRCKLHDLAWPAEVLAKIRACTAEAEDGTWVRAVGLDDAVLEGEGPGLSLLDAVTNGHAAVISPRFPRTIWVNSEALRQAGIDAATPDPAHGTIVRDAQGDATGVLRDAAVGQLWPLASVYTTKQFREGLRLASAQANRLGITSSSEAKAHPAHWAAFRAAGQAGELTLRMNVSLAWDEDRGPEQLPDLLRMRAGANGPLLRVVAVKMTVDGGSMGESASVLEPYTGTDKTGSSIHGANLAPRVVSLDAAGFDVHLHAFGDRAVRDGLDAIEAAVATNPYRERRHHLAHIALIHPDDLPRFAGLGVTADIQPLWAWLDNDLQDLLRSLGPERGQRYLPFRDLFDSGALVVAGSDWISESMSPLYGIQVAVTRRPPDGNGPAWLPEQRVTLEEMLRAYTRNGAIAAGQGELTGSIEVGKAADLIVLESNLFEIDPMALKDVKVLLTLLAGREVHRTADFMW